MSGLDNRKRILSYSVSASVLALVMSAGAAMAQQAAAPPEQVVVTGSLFQNSNFVAPTPVTAISSQEIGQSAVTGIGTVISQLPFFSAGSGLVNNTSGINSAGRATPNLRGLGQNATLVLIDGQRPTPVNENNNFDTNMIPSNFLQRFDVVTTGASATYGADAVAGAVNFVLNHNVEGFHMDARWGISERGDNDQPYGSFAYGTSFMGGKMHVEFGAEASANMDTVTSLARDWGKLEPGLVTLPANRAAGLPANIFTNHAEFDSYTPGGIINSGPLKGVAFDASGNPYNFQYGPAATVGSIYMIGTGNYGQSSLNRQLAPPRPAGHARKHHLFGPPGRPGRPQCDARARLSRRLCGGICTR